jgi:hypothetical protein
VVKNLFITPIRRKFTLPRFTGSGSMTTTSLIAIQDVTSCLGIRQIYQIISRIPLAGSVARPLTEFIAQLSACDPSNDTAYQIPDSIMPRIGTHLFSEQGRDLTDDGFSRSGPQNYRKYGNEHSGSRARSGNFKRGKECTDNQTEEKAGRATLSESLAES